MRRFGFILPFIIFASSVLAEDLDEASISRENSGVFANFLDSIGVRKFQKSYALIVGIDEFDDFNNLPTENDPLRMRDFLVEKAGFDHVHVLTGKNVTKARLEELILDEFRPLVGPEDRFLFYWSGHGVTLQNGAGTVGFLPVADSQEERISTMVAMDDIRRWDNFLQARQVLYLLDSCFSGLAGSAPKSNDLADITIEQLSGPARHMLTAGNGDEQTIAIDALGGSVFTHAILKGLEGAADAVNANGSDKLVSLGELKEFVSQEVAIQRERFGWNESITPQLRDLSGSSGAFFFPVVDDQPPPPPPPPPPPMLEIQRMLFALGLYTGALDGELTIETQRAIIEFELSQGLEPTGMPGPLLQAKLLIATMDAAEAVVVAQGSGRGLSLEPGEADGKDDDGADTDDDTEQSEDQGGTLPETSGPGEPPCPACPEMVLVSGGDFTIGRDNGKPEQGPPISVAIAPFELARTETTQAAFAEYVMAEGLDFVSRKVEADPSCYAWTADGRLRQTAYAYNQQSETAADMPISCVSREDVQGFIDWMNIDNPGLPYRLPTEAEYEYALTRGMILSGRVDGGYPGCALRNAADASSTFKWKDNSCQDSFSGVAPVASMVEDGLGLFDMTGNLWEWVGDCWTSTHSRQPSFEGCETGTLKGASFDDPLENLHPTTRQPAPAKRRQTNIGFRLARDAG